ncbi:MAG TPA: hypothetical protein VF773_00995 [Verrucomicrobiae bacterium]
MIAVILPKSADLELLIPIAREHHRALRAFNNRQLSSQLGPEVASFVTATGHCDCGTPLGSGNREAARNATSATSEERQLAILRRKGWSAAKIERWLEQKAGVAVRSERVRRDHDQHETPAATEWVSFIQAMVASGGTSSVGLHLHNYGGDYELEEIRIGGRRSLRAAELDADYLLRIEEDVVYAFW